MGWTVSCLPDLVADYRDSGGYILSTWEPVLLWCCRLQLTSLTSMIVLQRSLHYFEKDRVFVLCVYLGAVPCLWLAIGFVIVQLTAVFCPSVQYLSIFREEFS